MSGELSEDTILTLKHPELVDPVMSSVARFRGETGELRKALLVSMKMEQARSATAIYGYARYFAIQK